MIANKQTLQFIMILLMPCLLLLGADYYLLAFYEGTLGEKVLKALYLLELFIVPLRIAVLFLFTASLYLSLSMKRYETPEKQIREVKIPAGVQVIAGLFAVLGAVIFIMFEKFGINFRYGYPASLLIFAFSLPLIQSIMPRRKRKLTSLVKRPKVSNEVSINFKTNDQGYVNNVEPYRHTLVVAGSGSGKTVSVVRPTMVSNAKKDFCGIQFDYKYPALTDELHTILIREKSKMPLYVIDFSNIKRTHRVNPIEAKYLKNINYAEEVATAIVNNLDKSSVKNPDGFFTGSAINWLTSIIWFYKINHPEQCTLPHVINTVLHDNYKHVFSMLLCETECANRVRSIVTSLDANAERQLAGQVSTLQNMVVKLNSPMLSWILSASDFSLDINDPKDPKILSVGMEPQIRKSLAPVVSCIFTVALQLMNVQNKHKSFLMVDEAASIHLDDLDHLAAVARDNKIAITIILQEIAMYRDKYGADKSESIMGNMNNVFFGKSNVPRSAEMISKNIGTELREVIGKGESMKYMNNDGMSMNQSFSVQDKPIIKPSEVTALKKGQFVGRTTDEKQPYFYAQFKKVDIGKIKPLPDFVEFLSEEDGLPIDDPTLLTEENFERIKEEVDTIVSGYKNIYDNGSQEQLLQA